MTVLIASGERVWGALLVAAYAAFGLGGIALERRAESYRIRPPTESGRWVPDDFAPAGRRWVAWNARWDRARRFALPAVLVLGVIGGRVVGRLAPPPVAGVSASPSTALPWARGMLLALVAAGLLQATILHPAMERIVVRPWLATSTRAGRVPPGVLRDARVRRGWPLVIALIAGAAWWNLGTPAGTGWFAGAPG